MEVYYPGNGVNAPRQRFNYYDRNVDSGVRGKTFIIDGLTVGVEYTFEVTAINDCGSSTMVSITRRAGYRPVCASLDYFYDDD